MSGIILVGIIILGGFIFGEMARWLTLPKVTGYIFAGISDQFINIILGATVIHELIGPVLAKFSLRRAGEIQEK